MSIHPIERRLITGLRRSVGMMPLRPPPNKESESTEKNDAGSINERSFPRRNRSEGSKHQHTVFGEAQLSRLGPLSPRRCEDVDDAHIRLSAAEKPAARFRLHGPVTVYAEAVEAPDEHVVVPVLCRMGHDALGNGNLNCMRLEYTHVNAVGTAG